MHEQQNISFREIIKTLKNCNHLLMQYRKDYIYVTVLVMVVIGIIPALSTILMQQIINSLQIGVVSYEYYLKMIMFYVGLDLINTVVNSAYSLYVNRFSLCFDKRIKTDLLVKASKLSLSDYENHETYNTINRAKMQDGRTILTFYNTFASILQTIITVVSLLLILSTYKLWIVLPILLFPFANYLLSIMIGKMQYTLEVSRTEEQRSSWYIDHLIMTGQAYKEIKLFSIADYMVAKYDKLKSKFIQQDLKIYKKSVLGGALFSILDQIISGAVFLLIISSGLVGKILIGDVVTYTRCIFSIKTDVGTIFSSVSSIVKESYFIKLLFDFLQMSVTEQVEKIEVGQIDSISFEHVNYKYPFADNYCLQDINFQISRGKNIGFVGKNGAGKSTLAKLLMGFYTDYEGDIYINGIELRNLDIESYQKRIGCIFQDYIKYEGTLRENVGFGDLSKLNDDMEIINQLKRVKSDPELYATDRELDILLGNWFGKRQISIGEWQRIAIARALVKNADMYILDEPDASLDVIAEKEMLHHYRKIFKDKIGVFITHKISQVPYLADHIIVLDDGKIAECGSHNELLSKNGLYKQLYEQGGGTNFE